MKIYSTLFFCFFVFIIKAQVGNNWYFGENVAFNFNTNITQTAPILLNTNALVSDEGCTSISDSLGNLLFYSNGRKVFNKTHSLMLNGDNLFGHPSAFQSSIAVKKPGNNNLYYLFTCDAFENNFNVGYHYSIIDMRNDNGKGEVITKNVLLTVRSTERLTAVQHSNGIDVWIITNDYNSNVFKCWLLTCNGLQALPVINTIGDVLDVYVAMNIGALMASPDGKKICQTYFPDGASGGVTPFFQLFDFDASTGILSNTKKISLNRYAYGCCFSPNSKLLYLTDPNLQSIVQLEATLPTVAAIQNSMVIIPTSFGLFGMQIAPNLKMYVARNSKYVVQINYPNNKGLNCNYSDDSTIVIQNGMSLINYPQYINNSFFDPYNGFTFNNIDSCNGILQFNAYSNLSGTVQYQWDFGDGQSSSLQNVTHNYAIKNRQYNVTLKIINNTNCASPIYKSNIVIPQGILVNLQFDSFSNCDSNKVVFINKSFSEPNFSNYLWQFGDGQTSTLKNPIHNYSSAGNYTITLQLQNVNTCVSSTITKNIQISGISLQVPNQLQINEGESIQLNTLSNGTNFAWTPNKYLNDSTLLSPIASPIVSTTYNIKAINNNNCSAFDSVTITVKPKTEIFIPNVFTPNNDGVNDFIRPNYSLTYNNITFNIYDKWGKKVFDGNTNNQYKWDGKIKQNNAINGTYVYYFRANNLLGESKFKKGTIILLR